MRSKRINSFKLLFIICVFIFINNNYSVKIPANTANKSQDYKDPRDQSEQNIYNIHPAHNQEFIKSTLDGVENIFVIVNKTSVRFNNIKKLEAKLNLKFNYIQPESTDSDATVNLLKSKNWTTNTPHIGCYSSHLKIWKDIIQKNISASLVLEDDLDATIEFHQEFNNIYKSLENKWPDLFLVGHCFITCPLDAGIINVYDFSCTHGYVCSFTNIGDYFGWC
jgi:hypothetical protein